MPTNFPEPDPSNMSYIQDMFVAGTDTTSATLEWTMTQLVRHPDEESSRRSLKNRINHCEGRREPTSASSLHESCCEGDNAIAPPGSPACS